MVTSVVEGVVAVNHMHCRFLGAGPCAVDARVGRPQLGVLVLPRALVLRDQSTGPFAADLVLSVGAERVGVVVVVQVRKDVGLLFRQTLVQRLRLVDFVRVAEVAGSRSGGEYPSSSTSSTPRSSRVSLGCSWSSLTATNLLARGAIGSE